MTYASPVFAHAIPTTLHKLQVVQNKFCQTTIDAPWCVRNSVLHRHFDFSTVSKYKTNAPKRLFTSVESNPNALLSLTFSYEALCPNHVTRTANPGDLPLGTYVEGCRDPPCQLPQLQDAVIHVLFRTPRDVATLSTLATAYIRLGVLSIPIAYDLQENSVTCNFLNGVQCPLQEGQIVDYTLRMHIESFFPIGTSVTVEFRVVDEASQPVLCIRVPITIIAPSTLRITA
ncbi:hypothetical protein EVAR_65141_1 [Eumeta japonica]|uniref:MD-2-related lipid-recognition domain-containing protein n=1 Tax=Eumeta variegata TaxID=151549 RepID=A0A4C1ZTX9_EUMVA|nr:hypothetical protein EVAR_65141_1 [Eumeta japonica]